MLRQMFRDMMRDGRGYNVAPYTDILKSLEKMDKKMENRKTPVDWSFVRLQLGSMECLKRDSDFTYDVFFCLFKLFNKYKCKDFSIIADTYQLQCFVFEYSSNSFRKARQMTDLMKQNIACFETDGLNYVAHLMKMPYKSNTSPYSLMYDVIQMYVVSIEDKLLSQLLEFGVMYIPLSDHRSTWAHCRQRMSILLGDSEKPLLLNSRTIQANFKQLSPESRQRMLAVFRGVEVILKARVDCAVDFGLCFRMAYETIPEPVIRSHEIVAFLKKVLSGASADALITAIAKDYEKLFPESLEPSAPRTLKQLSRCQVRQNLRQAGNYPYGLTDLSIPAALKNYIHVVLTDYMWEKYNSYKA